MTQAFPAEQRGVAIGTWAGVSALALAIGAVVGLFALAAVAQITFAMFAQFFFVTLYLQNVLHYSPLETGIRFLPSTLVIIVMGPLARVSPTASGRGRS